MISFDFLWFPMISLAVLLRQDALLAFASIGYRLLGLDERKCHCNLPPSSSKLHLRHLLTADPGHWASLGERISATYCPPTASGVSTIADVEYRPLGMDEWDSRCNVPASSGKLRLWQWPLGLTEIGQRLICPDSVIYLIHYLIDYLLDYSID